MDNLRPLLWLSLAFVLFLMWQAWNQDYGTPAQPETAEQEAEDPDARPEDVPDAPQFEDEDDPRAAADVSEISPIQEPDRRQFTVRTDKHELLIDTLLVNGTARLMGFLGSVLRVVQNGQVQRYVAFVFLGIAIILYLVLR